MPARRAAGRSPRPGSCCRPTSTCRRRRTSTDDLAPLLAAGIDDWGGVSPVTVDHVNPERPWPALDVLREATEAARATCSRPGSPSTPSSPATRRAGSTEAMRFPVLDASDAEGLPATTRGARGRDAPPHCSTGRRRRRSATWRARGGRRGAVAEVLAGVALGQEVGEDEIVTLFCARGPEVRAGRRGRRRAAPRRSSATPSPSSHNRNINYTNVCTFKCRFCAFSKGPLSLNLRGAPYLLELDEITGRVVEAEEEGATEVCLQGGIHPTSTATTTSTCSRPCARAPPTIHIHGFTALEVTEGARRSSAAGRVPRRA